MDLRHLRYFIAIAEEGSFLRAATRLHISQPPLSSQVKDLENELGVKLFDRSSRGVALTAAGGTFYQEARAVLARLEHAKISVLRASRGDAGTLSVGFVSIADYGVLPPALKAFRARFPAVDVQLHELTTDAQIREIAAERLDLGIGLAPVDEPGLRFETIVREELVLAAPADHPMAASGEPVDLRDLAAENFVLVPRDRAPGLYDLVISHCRACGFTPRIVQHAKQMQTVISLVASGFGFALVPSSIQNLQRTGVRYLRLQGKPPRIEVGLVYRRQSNDPVLKNFMASVKAASAALQSAAEAGPATAPAPD